MSKYLTIFIVVLSFVSLQSCDRQCKKTECYNNGSCYEGECICEKWYSGDQCELFYNRNYDGVFVGSYAAGETLFPRRQDSIIVSADATIPNRMNIENSFYYDFVSDSTLTIPIQTIYGTAELIQVEGAGEYTSDKIRLEYIQTKSSVDGQLQESIIFTGSKD